MVLKDRVIFLPLFAAGIVMTGMLGVSGCGGSLPETVKREETVAGTEALEALEAVEEPENSGKVQTDRKSVV